MILAISVSLRRRWEPVLENLTDALRELAAGRYRRVALEGAGDAPRVAAQEFNRTIAILGDKMRAMASLNDIDRMLLESVDLESCLDALLERVGNITGCDSAMLVLLDRDASRIRPGLPDGSRPTRAGQPDQPRFAAGLAAGAGTRRADRGAVRARAP